MTFENPAVWGPILVAAIVYLSAQEIKSQLLANSVEVRQFHRELMEAIETIQDDLKSLSLDISTIERTACQPMDETDYD